MKVTGMEIEKIILPLKHPFKIALGMVYNLECVMVKISTDNGLTGYGEAAPFSPVTGETVDGVIPVLEMFRPELMGMDPWEIEKIHVMMDSMISGNGSAKCAVDLAMYDLMGKDCGQPVYKLLGGFSNQVESDITLSIDVPEKMAAEAYDMVKNHGYRILKIKAGINLEEDIRAMKAIRDAVGPEIRLRADANQGYSVADSVIALNAFSEYGIEAVEQCLPYWNVEGSAEVRRKVNHVKIMLDESIHSPEDAARACRMGAADILNIKLMKCGGLYPAMKINAIAEAFGVTCMVGCMAETKLAITAGLSLVAAKKNITEADCDSFQYYKDQPAEGGFHQEGGLFTLSEKPGFGIELLR